MPRFALKHRVLLTCGAIAFVLMPAFAGAHQAHEMACNEAAIKAMDADMQSMPDGEAKATAMKEMGAAKDMMASEDMKGCEMHLHKAMKAMDE